MPIKSFETLESNMEITWKTVRELSFDNTNNISFLQSEMQLIDFDALAKTLKEEVGSSAHSPDALMLSGDVIHFIEFKNQKWQKIITNCLSKLYDGLSIFGICSQNESKLNEVCIVFTIICSPEKNYINIKKTQEENPVSEIFGKNLELSEEPPLSNQDVSNYEKERDGKLKKARRLTQGLSKYGIQIEMNILFIQEEIDNFLSQFEKTRKQD